MSKSMVVVALLLPLLAHASDEHARKWMDKVRRVSDSEASLETTLRELGRPLRRETIVTPGGNYARPKQRPICARLPAGVSLTVLTYRDVGEAPMERQFYFNGSRMSCKTWYFVNAAGVPQDGP